jgi:hypothetical protein
MPAMSRMAVLLAFLVAACGGTSRPSHADPPGQSRAGMTVEGDPHEGPDPAEIVDAEPPPPPPPPVTFVLRNTGKTELAFNLDKGWQPVLFGFTGKPPKARSALLFPEHCTGPCDAADVEEMCPVCEVAEDARTRRKQEIEGIQREIAQPGEEVTVGWDGMVYVYEKAPAAMKRRGCQCWRKGEARPDTYTIRACGWRPPPKPGKPSTPVCADTQVELPPAETPATITLEFPK